MYEACSNDQNGALEICTPRTCVGLLGSAVCVCQTHLLENGFCEIYSSARSKGYGQNGALEIHIHATYFLSFEFGCLSVPTAFFKKRVQQNLLRHARTATVKMGLYEYASIEPV